MNGMSLDLAYETTPSCFYGIYGCCSGYKCIMDKIILSGNTWYGFYIHIFIATFTFMRVSSFAHSIFTFLN